MTKQQKTEHVVSQPLLCDHLFDLLTRKCVSYRDIREKNAKSETHYHYLQSWVDYKQISTIWILLYTKVEFENKDVV